MKPFISMLVFVILAGFFSSCARQDLTNKTLEPLASWSNLGSKVNTVDDEIISALAFNDLGNPIVAIRESRSLHANYRIYVKQWVNGNWGVLGNVINLDANQTASAPSLAVDKMGRPVVAWTETTTQGSEQIYVKRWNGQVWVRLGGRLNVKSAIATTITIDSQNRPVVAWTEYSPNLPVDNWNLYVKRWENDSSWVQLGSYLDVVEGDSAGNISMSIDRLDRPIVAWQETNLFFSSSKVYVKRWNGTKWTSLGGFSGRSPSIVMTSTGKLYMAFKQELNKLIVNRYDGNGVWTSLPSIRPYYSTSNYSFAPYNDTIMIVWGIDGLEAYGKRWNGVDRWLNVGSQPILTESRGLILAVSPSGVPTVVYRYEPSVLSQRGNYVMQYQ